MDENSEFNLPVMVDLMIHQVGVMVVEAHAGEGLAHVPIHVLAVQSRVPALEAVAVKTDAVVAMTLTVEAKERADQGHTVAAKVATVAARTAKAHVIMETRGAR